MGKISLNPFLLVLSEYMGWRLKVSVCTNGLRCMMSAFGVGWVLVVLERRYWQVHGSDRVGIYVVLGWADDTCLRDGWALVIWAGFISSGNLYPSYTFPFSTEQGIYTWTHKGEWTY